MSVRIPIFVSSPTDVNSEQEKSRLHVLREMRRYHLEPRALGRSDYPTELPLREVQSIARHCVGGVILGFSQFSASSGVWKAGTPREVRERGNVLFPSPWNQLEAGLLFSLGLPLLIFREIGITGGIFDPGVTDVFVHPMPPAVPSSREWRELREVFLKWQSDVRMLYYGRQ